jgi:alkylation response protein AidB-like acyl-CoA dehydrogenase
MAVRDQLALTADQRALRDTLRGFLADQLPSATLRGMLDTDAAYSPELHARLAAELGLSGLTVSEEFGGLGLSQAEACVVHTELGRALYPGPFLPSILAASALAAGDRAIQAQWLPLLADGSVTGTIAVADKDGLWSSGSGGVRAHLTPHGWQLYGRCWYVIAAHVAGIVVVSALAGSATAMFLVESGSPGFAVSPMPGLDLTRRVCVTAFDATPAVLLSQGADAAAALDRAEREFLLATAAEAAGGIGWCLDAAMVCAKDREQSGRPIGSFQAVAQTCVDMLAAFQEVSAAARYAAVADADAAAEAPMAARVAALRAGQAYRDVTEAAIHLFGGIGFTREHDAHLYYRRAWSAERLSGGPRAHRAAVAGLAGLGTGSADSGDTEPEGA